MPSHVHASFIDAAIVWAMVVILGFLWRSGAAIWSDRPIGQAMGFVY